MKLIINKNHFCGLVLLCLLFFALQSLAQDSVSQSPDTPEIAKVRSALSQMIQETKDIEIEATPAKNVYRAVIDGQFLFVYVSENHILFGDLYDTQRKVSLSEEARERHIAKKIQTLSSDNMIVFGPKDGQRYVTVFTDIDCGYCRKLHREVPELNKAGIEVRYLPFPRAGVPSKSYTKFVNVWCSDDQQAALTAAKAGEIIEAKTCKNTVKESYELGRELGIRGTPTMVLDDGRIVPGYMPHNELVQLLLDK